MQRKNLKNDSDYPLIMTRELAAEFIGVSGNTFDKYYRYAHNFPVVKNGDVEEAFPRDPIIKWIADNWQLLEKGRRYSIIKKHLKRYLYLFFKTIFTKFTIRFA